MKPSSRIYIEKHSSRVVESFRVQLYLSNQYLWACNLRSYVIHYAENLFPNHIMTPLLKRWLYNLQYQNKYARSWYVYPPKAERKSTVRRLHHSKLQILPCTALNLAPRIFLYLQIQERCLDVPFHVTCVQTESRNRLQAVFSGIIEGSCKTSFGNFFEALRY